MESGRDVHEAGAPGAEVAGEHLQLALHRGTHEDEAQIPSLAQGPAHFLPDFLGCGVPSLHVHFNDDECGVDAVLHLYASILAHEGRHTHGELLLKVEPRHGHLFSNYH